MSNSIAYCSVFVRSFRFCLDVVSVKSPDDGRFWPCEVETCGGDADPEAPGAGIKDLFVDMVYKSLSSCM